MKRNTYDKSNCLEMGEEAETLFKELAKSRGVEIKEASGFQNSIEHWDIALRKEGNWYKVEVKARKKLYRYEKEAQDRYTIIELQGVTGYPGWLYGKADFFAFAREDRFIIVEKNNLIKLVEEKLTLGIYEIRTRPNRQDKFFSLQSRLIDEIKTAEWLF